MGDVCVSESHGWTADDGKTLTALCKDCMIGFIMERCRLLKSVIVHKDEKFE